MLPIVTLPFVVFTVFPAVVPILAGFTVTLLYSYPGITTGVLDTFDVTE